MCLFWERGYCAASIHDVVKATGVARGSLYATYKDKADLFAAALDRYEQRFGKAMLDAAEDASGAKNAVKAMLAVRVGALTDASLPRGCFAVNTVLDGGVPNSVSTKAQSAVHAQLAFLAKLFRDDGREAAEAAALAGFVVSIIQGLGVLARSGAEPRAIEQAAEVALQAL